MNANSASTSDVCSDADILIEVFLHFDPSAAHSHSSVFFKVRDKLLCWGWSEVRFNKAVTKLRSGRRLFLSNSRKTMSFQPLSNPHSIKNRCCAYCGKMTGKLTKDHVIPKSKGGTRCASNIVMACEPCNQAKADRTPDQWARDILNYRNRAK